MSGGIPVGPVFQCRVAGLPRTQGSKRPGMTRNKDPEKRRAVLFEQNSAAHAKWRADVERAARLVLFERGHPPIIDYPMRALFLFAIHRPKNPTHEYPTAKINGDWDKLGRAASDALKVARVYTDDSLILDGRVLKLYAGDALIGQPTPGLIIRIWPYATSIPEQLRIEGT